MTRRIALGTAALALCGALFFSCSNSAGGNLLAGADGTGAAGSQPTQGGGNGQTQSPATISYNEVWSGSQKIDWDANGVSIDHAKFTADFDSLRVTYNASAGAIKLSVCEPWTDITLTAASVNDGTIADDGAFNLPTGDNKTVTIKLSDTDVAGIKGQGQAGAWGGVKIYGADTVTLLKVESFKAAASATPAPQPQPQAQAQDPGLLFESSEGWTEDWKAKTFEAAKFAAAVTGSQIKFTVRKNTDQYVDESKGEAHKYDDCYSLIQLLDGDAKLVSGTITGGEIEGENLKPLYKNADSTDDYDESHVFTMVYTPSADEINILKTKGVGVQAHGTRILKIEFVAAPASK
ncbi:MAG: hypothetical protein IKN82_03035 [Treponema sp.]|nr:hypothetical protein [Treponema sp.]